MSRLLTAFAALGLLGMSVAVPPPVAAQQEGALKPGDQAPAFSLPGSDGRTYSLAGLKGKTVVLAWFPKAFTGG